MQPVKAEYFRDWQWLGERSQSMRRFDRVAGSFPSKESARPAIPIEIGVHTLAYFGIRASG